VAEQRIEAARKHKSQVPCPVCSWDRVNPKCSSYWEEKELCPS